MAGNIVETLSRPTIKASALKSAVHHSFPPGGETGTQKNTTFSTEPTSHIFVGSSNQTPTPHSRYENLSSQIPPDTQKNPKMFNADTKVPKTDNSAEARIGVGAIRPRNYEKKTEYHLTLGQAKQLVGQEDIINSRKVGEIRFGPETSLHLNMGSEVWLNDKQFLAAFSKELSEDLSIPRPILQKEQAFIAHAAEAIQEATAIEKKNLSPGARFVAKIAEAARGVKHKLGQRFEETTGWSTSEARKFVGDLAWRGSLSSMLIFPHVQNENAFFKLGQALQQATRGITQAYKDIPTPTATATATKVPTRTATPIPSETPTLSAENIPYLYANSIPEVTAYPWPSGISETDIQNASVTKDISTKTQEDYYFTTLRTRLAKTTADNRNELNRTVQIDGQSVVLLPSLDTLMNDGKVYVPKPDASGLAYVGYKPENGSLAQLRVIRAVPNLPDGVTAYLATARTGMPENYKDGTLIIVLVQEGTTDKIVGTALASTSGSITMSMDSATDKLALKIGGENFEDTIKWRSGFQPTETLSATVTATPTETPIPTETQPAEKPFVALENMNTVEDCAKNELPNPVTEPEKFQIAYEKWMQNSQDWYNDPANIDVRAEAKLLNPLTPRTLGAVYKNVFTGNIDKDNEKIYPSCATIDGYEGAYIYNIPALIKNTTTGKTEVVQIGFFGQIPELTELASKIPTFQNRTISAEQTFADFHGDNSTVFTYFNPPLTNIVNDWSNILDPDTVTQFELTRELVQQLFADPDNYQSAITKIAEGKADTNAIAAFRNSCNKHPIPIDIDFFLKKK